MVKFLKSLGVYFFGNILSKVITFIMLPIYTLLIKPEDYGYYDVSLTYLEILTGIIFVNLQLGILRFMYDKKTIEGKYNTIFNTIPIYLSSTVLFIATMLIADIFMNIKYLYLIIIYGIFFTLEKCTGYIARGLGYNTLFAITGVVSTLIIVTVNTVGLLWLKLDYWILYLAFILGSFSQILIITLKTNLFKKMKKMIIDFSESVSILKFCVPMAVNSVVYWFLSGYNKIIIANELGVEASGYYAIAIKFGVVVSLIGTVFGWALQEVSFDVEANKSEKERSQFYSYLIIKYLQLLIIGISILIVGVSIVFPIMVHDSYSVSYSLIPLYMLASMLNTYSTFYTNIFAAIKKTNIVFYSTVVSSIINIIIMTFLVENIGVQASNISLIISYSLDIIIKHTILSKKIKLEINVSNILSLFPLVIISIFGFFNFSLIFSILYIFAFIVLFVFMFRQELINLISEIKQ